MCVTDIMNDLFSSDLITAKFITSVSFMCFLLLMDWIFRSHMVIFSVHMVKIPDFYSLKVKFLALTSSYHKYIGYTY